MRVRVLLFSFLIATISAYAADKIKIQIVKLTSMVSLGHTSSFQARAILPDGLHAMLICEGDEKGCGGFPSFTPEKSPDAGGCSTSQDGSIVTCTATDLGYFSAKRDGNDLLIYVPKGKRKYRIIGSW